MQNRTLKILFLSSLALSLGACSSLAYDITKGTANAIVGVTKVAAKTATATTKLAAKVATAPFKSKKKPPEDFNDSKVG